MHWKRSGLDVGRSQSEDRIRPTPLRISIYHGQITPTPLVQYTWGNVGPIQSSNSYLVKQDLWDESSINKIS